MLRLGNQRREAKQLILALTIPGRGWANHPAAKMWRGHERALACYGLTICREWIGRGYNDSLAPWFTWQIDLMDGALTPPSWLDDAFCKSHRSNLLRKNAAWYSQFGWDVPSDLPYVWPAV